MEYKDQRIKLTSEILSGMKILKLYAWEKSFEQQILDIREKEVSSYSRSRCELGMPIVLLLVFSTDRTTEEVGVPSYRFRVQLVHYAFPGCTFCLRNLCADLTRKRSGRGQGFRGTGFVEHLAPAAYDATICCYSSHPSRCSFPKICVVVCLIW